MYVRQVIVESFPPLRDQSIQFPGRNWDDAAHFAEVHLLVGQNGTGKTRLLAAIAAAYGNPAPLSHRLGEVSVESPDHTNTRRVKKGASVVCTVKLSDSNPGMAALAFRAGDQVFSREVTPLAGIEQSPRKDLSFSQEANASEDLCQAIVNLKLHGALDLLEENLQSPAISQVSRIESTVSEITRKKFQFRITRASKFGVNVNWGGVTTSLERLPDGLRSIISWLVSCASKLERLRPGHSDPLSAPFCMLLDEPETHLHPAWQRQVLPAAQRFFPGAQLIVATHSPFVISSVNKGWLHLFREEQDHQVKIDEPKLCGAGDTYIDAVEDALGVREWYDPETEGHLGRFRELRGEVLRRAAPLADLEELALKIAQRSRSLDEMMGREMRQVVRALQPQEATP